ncbi:FliG C-terminal domain-containing protein [Halobacteriovorax sp. HLS]|uniref:FliG C-terminal domain-containing protein n=1 Tax=Halobacteriovorax sp. HLS TaxID=2234000 RepID=UPI000FDA6A1A|nr:FliG C-terminal domain-containing protein [Halobacteriovorax sp. HLS]
MPFKGGIKEAAKMLASLSTQERTRILADIAKRDPQRAEVLKKEMVTLEDLKYITVKMLVELLREVKIEDLALALRLGSEDLKTHITSNVSSSMKEEINSILNTGPRPVSEVEESIEKVMQVVRKKLDKGELILSQDGEELV